VTDFEDAREVVRVCARQRPADEGALALHSQGIEASVRRASEGWLLETRAADAARARAVLEAFERENAPRPPPPPIPVYPFPWAAALVYALALLWFFVWTGPRAGESAWFAAGSARASRMVALGEWWRALTALTLHADLSHVLGNVLAGALFGGTVCARVGTGVGAALLLAAGALGNVANALYWRAGGHDSVGASTAVFAAVGVLAADALLARRLPRGGRLAPFGAALGLFAMLGTSERADYGAHLFGLAAGFALGVGVLPRIPAPPPRPVQIAAGALAAAALAAAWELALRS
jgi:membrane associated rhomboid family serine protease